MKKDRKIFLLFMLVFFSAVFCLNAAADKAADITKDTQIEVLGINKAQITDESLTSGSSGENVSINIMANQPIGGVYVRYYSSPENGLMTVGGKDTQISKDGFLAEYIAVEDETTSVLLRWSAADICEISVYSKGVLPKDVQLWQNDKTETDLLLLATHSDDDQLFFAGLLPYYKSRDGVRVRVAYFVSHNDASYRLHELLCGLWECGVRLYPEIGIFPDAYSESFDLARMNLERDGYSYDRVLEYQRYLLEKYRPLVLVLHDISGEYGHGQHIINTKSMLETLENSHEGDFVPEKVYIHLFPENKISLDIDTPLEYFGGRTAFQVSQTAFSYHKSQHWCWFYGWLYGKNTKITSSTQISSYNPANYGLYYTSVGFDSEKNDMLENISTYEERQRQEEERLEAELLEEQKLLQELKEKEEKEEAERRKAKERMYLILGLCVCISIFTSAFSVPYAISKKKKRK